MNQPSPPNTQRRTPVLYWRERWLLAVAFIAILLAGLIVTYTPVEGGDGVQGDIVEAALLGLLAAVLCGLLLERVGMPLWHALANAFPEKTPFVIAAPRVIDGDTIDDMTTGVRYRFPNIDAPETGDGAKCANEAQRGELARLAVVTMINRAKRVTARRTWRWDHYARRIAFVYADGVDIGKALVAKGFARPWRGRRETWCGPTGGLAKIGATRAMPISCKRCGAWSRF